MALAYTAPIWTDDTGEGISASNLQAISNCIEGLVQGSDKAVHNVQIEGSNIILTYADGTQETFTAVDIKSISQIAKTGTSGNVDTYTITYSDGTSDTFTVTNGQDGGVPDITATATADATSSATPTVTVTKTGTDEAPEFAFAFSGLKGEQGQQGQTGPAGQDGTDGTDGVSPEVTITSITGGHTVTITDEEHPSGQSFNVMDGTDGTDGTDGVSPGVTITTITGGHRITITDATHPSGQSFDVMDGSGSGDMQASTYDPTSAVATAGGIPAYVASEISGKADDSDLDGWTAEQTISTSDTSKTFTGLNANYAYKPFIQVADGEDELQYNSIVFSGTSCTVSFDSPSAAQAAGNACKIKLRIVK